VRRLVLEREWEVEARAEALLFMASRAQMVARELRPALDRGELVLLDRFFLSTYAYQIGGRSLPEGDVRAANRLATGGLVPDLTLLLTYPVADGLARAAERSAAHDRMEREGEAFHARVADAFGSFASADWQRSHPECGPIVSIEAVGSERDVAVRVREELLARWPGTFPAIEASDD
jgi:dTMP kinase